MSQVRLENLNKFYGGLHAVKDLNLDVADREFLVLVGPSGCGKSTTLRMVAGLESITAGTIRIGDQVVNHLQPRDRDIAMVFQNYALYMHMNVFDNMAFGLRNRKVPADEIERKVQETAAILGINELMKRRPAQLSGGQRQRVALGRAIVRDPKVFLFDEPLSNLDAQLRTQMRFEIKHLHSRLETTVIYVTHDQVEAMTLGDRVVVMRNGEISQIGAPLQLYSKPRNRFVAAFIGSPMMNFLDARIEGENQALYADTESFRLRIPTNQAQSLSPYRDQRVILGVRPENIYLGEGAVEGACNFDGLIRGIEPLGPEQMLDIVAGQKSLVVSRVNPFLPVRAQEVASLHIVPDQVHYFDRDSEKVIAG